MSKNIIVTGGSGMAGKWVVKDLLAHGHQVLNLDRVPLKDSAARTLITDLTDAGQVFDAFQSTLQRHEFSPSLVPPKIDAVIHKAAHGSAKLAGTRQVEVAHVWGDVVTNVRTQRFIFRPRETTPRCSIGRKSIDSSNSKGNVCLEIVVQGSIPIHKGLVKLVSLIGNFAKIAAEMKGRSRELKDSS